MKIVYLTAGAAGMYCGSCLHDNALAKALIGIGHHALLVPTYTPILTDEASVSSDQLFYGGLNVYLQQAVPIFRWIPRWADQFLNSPRLVGWIARRAMGTSAEKLGALTVSMLRGSHGHQAKEVRRLCEWLKTESPDVVVFSNLLIAGCVPEIHRQLDCPVVVILQGDDIFFDSLLEPYRDQALAELRKLAQRVDGFVVHSLDYGRRMRHVLGFDERRQIVLPLTIDTRDFVEWQPEASQQHHPTIGYLARLAPEKGLHQLVDAFIKLRSRAGTQDCRLAIAGWLGKQNEPYWREQQDKLNAAGLSGQYEYLGSVDRQQKLDFLRGIDVLSVPTVSLEPKGLFVLEGLAAGVPFVQPAHGSFPEIERRHGGGLLYDPAEPDGLVQGLSHLVTDRGRARELGALGRQSVLGAATTQQEAVRFAEHLQQLVSGRQVAPGSPST